MTYNKIAFSLLITLIVTQPCFAQVKSYEWSRTRSQFGALPSGNPQYEDRAGALQRIGSEMQKVQQTLEQTRATSSAEQAAAERQAAQIRTEGEQAIARMKNSYTVTKTGRYPKYTDEEIAETQARYDNQVALLLARVPRISNDAIKRQESLIESAQDLQEQLQQGPAGCDSVMLQPVGTNLYVRNYQSIGEQYERMPHVQPRIAVPQLGTYQTGRFQNQPGTVSVGRSETNSVVSGQLLRAAKK